MIRAAALVLLLVAGPLRAEDFPALYAVTGVAADDVLNIRAAPEADAPILGVMLPDATGVEVVSATDGWAVVNAGEQAGYVSLKFLSREPGPTWYALEQPLACSGTEPFWSLAIDPGAGTVVYTTPDPEDLLEGKIGRTWPGEPWATTAALALPQGFAVVRPAACSDSMTDRPYGLAIDIFQNDGVHDRLAGCCVLGGQ
ncbi:COG3650 family protein [Tabrizicola sp.]|uniref:COG3650 family protein n=1 Tax=Tabrizicola sp. TaxID=2005166 RepID=UPI003F3666D7